MLFPSFVSQQHHVHVFGRSSGSPIEETTSIGVCSFSETSSISFWRRRQRSELCQTRCFWRQVRFFFKHRFWNGRYCFGYRTSQLTEFILVKQNCWKPSSNSLSQYWLLTLYWMTMGNRSNLAACCDFYVRLVLIKTPLMPATMSKFSPMGNDSIYLWSRLNLWNYRWIISNFGRGKIFFAAVQLWDVTSKL